MNNSLSELVQDVKSRGNFDRPKLYAVWHTRDRNEWNKNPEIYLAMGQQALELGEPIFAFDVIAEGLKNWSDNTGLQTLMGLSLARCGAAEKAQAMLETMYANGSQDEEIIGILARTHKDLWLDSSREDARCFHLERCAELYAKAYELHKGYWTGINAATFALLKGDKAQARSWAEEVREMCQGEVDSADDKQINNYWLFATLGESALIRECFSDARDWYQKALLLKNNSYGNLASTRRNAALVISAIGGDAGFLDDCLPRPRVIAFTGHIVDDVGRKSPRFPAEREQSVYSEIKKFIIRSGATIGFSSAACGADILFLEAMLEVGGEIIIVLPSSLENFIKSSVAVRSNGDWVVRFRKVAERAKHLVILSEQHTGDISYSYTNIVLCGLAKSYARQIDASLGALAVWDGEAGKVGGTGSAVQIWLACGQPVDTLNIATLKTNLLSPSDASINLTDALLPQQPDSKTGFSAELVSILFADVVDFSKFSENQIPAFVTHFLGAVGRLLENREYAPLTRNTWGDGLYFVFKDARSAGLVGLEICKLVNETDWSQTGLPKGLNVRIGLHSGPVYRLINPITGLLDYTGTHVSRAARIEPITPPGEVWASQAFAAISEASGIRDFICDYVGQTEMAKKYGVYPTYRVRPARINV